MIQIELHSAHGEPTGVPPTGATFPYVPPCNEPAEQVMNLLSQEIENMVIEGKILRESGPMKSLVDTILERRRNASRNSSPVREPGPSSPASPALAPMSFSTPSRIPSSPSRRAAGGERRPFGSPVPSGSRSTRTFIRARSRSLSC